MENYRSTRLGMGPESENRRILHSLTAVENLTLSINNLHSAERPFVVEVDKVGFESTPENLLNDLVFV